MQWTRFTVTLETLEPFRIGALENPLSGLHNPVTTVGDRVVVQGPSLKGALRYEVEDYLIQHYAAQKGMKPCIPTSANALSAAETMLIPAKYKVGGNCAYHEKSQRERQRQQEGPAGSLPDHLYICPACYLFGAMGLVGFVRVPYLFTDKRFEELYAVRIDRATHTVAEKTNREYQIVAPNVTFSGVIEIMTNDPVRGWEFGKPRKLPTDTTLGDLWLNNSNWTSETLLQEFVLDRLQAITIMGGFKSRGCGKVSITVAPLP